MSVLRRLLPALLALALGAGASWLVACGDSGDRGSLLAPADADAIVGRLDDARSAYAAGECDEAAQAVRDATRAADALPDDVDARLRERIAEGLDALRAEIVPDCRADRQEEEIPTGPTGPTVTETTTTETTTTETTTTETTPPETTTVPPETTTVPPETTTVPPETSPGGTGGVNPEGGAA